MRICHILVICLALDLLTGCSEQQAANRDNRSLDVELVKTLNNVGIENAIITQRTLFPYHFVANAGELNELGERDLAVLAGHFAQHPGILNVQRGDVPGDLYEKRIAQVLDRMQAAGVEMSRMSVSDDMPGGSGMTSNRVVTIVERATEGSTMAGSGGTGRITRQ